MWEILLLAVAAVQVGLTVAIYVAIRGRAGVTPGTDPEVLARFAALDASVDKLQAAMRDELARSRQEAAAGSAQLRAEVTASLVTLGDSLGGRLRDAADAQAKANDAFATTLGRAMSDNTDRLDKLRQTVGERLDAFRSTTLESFMTFGRDQQSRFDAAATADDEKARNLREEIVSVTGRLAESLKADLASAWTTFGQQLTTLSQAHATSMDALRTTVDGSLTAIRQDNEARLERIRLTVDEKLHNTLEQRLGESFKLVSERLENVQKGLGEMQSLASGVGDLKKVLTNVKTRGTWGEVLLGNLLEQILTPEQYAANVATTGTGERVEFAIRLPGRESRDIAHGNGSTAGVWLPIDSKFPKEDYERLLAAQDAGDPDAAASAGAALENAIRRFAQDICDKYVEVPKTTDFAIMFLPSEGLYAEVIRRTETVEHLQRKCRVLVTGPTTLAALLNSLQMGFRTLAIEKRSGEVWELLGAVKTEFGKYADVMAKVQKKLQEASNTIDTAAVRTRAINRQLRSVEQLSDDATTRVFPVLDVEHSEE